MHATTLLLVAAVAGAAEAPPQSRQAESTPPNRLPPPHEQYVPPALPPTSPQATSPAGDFVFGPFSHVQANIFGGRNVVNDAANESSIAVDPSAPNRIAIGWRQFDNIGSSFRQAGYNYSIDGGRTWGDKAIIEPLLFRSDPVLTAGNDGTFYYLSLSVVGGKFRCDVFTSYDGGQTWPEKNFAYGGDKSWFTIDNSAGPGAGNMYQAWNTAGNAYFPAQFNRTVDGVTWEEPVEYAPLFPGPPRPVFGELAVGPDSQVYVAGPENGSGTDEFWAMRSLNAADPEATPEFAVSAVDMGGTFILASGPNPGGLLGQMEVDVSRSGGPDHGNIYILASIHKEGVDSLDVHFVRSEDGGATWSEPVRVNDDEFGSKWQWFGTMSVAPNGRIDAIWNDTRNSFQHNMSQLYYSFSEDAGRTWAPNVMLSPTFNSHLGWPQQNKLGDYYDMVSDNVGAHVAWAATFNGEQDVYYLRIGDYDCNGNSIGDSEDLASGAAADCNANDIPDSCEIAAGASADVDDNGVPDECQCLEDVDGDGDVDVDDLVGVILAWGDLGGPADVNHDGIVDVDDLTAVILAWGSCKETA